MSKKRTRHRGIIQIERLERAGPGDERIERLVAQACATQVQRVYCRWRATLLIKIVGIELQAIECKELRESLGTYAAGGHQAKDGRTERRRTERRRIARRAGHGPVSRHRRAPFISAR